MWFFTKKIGEIVEEKFKETLAQHEAELQNTVSETQGKIGSLQMGLEAVEADCLRLRRKTFKAQGIEKIIFHPDYISEDKQRLIDIAKTQFNLQSYRISRLSFPIKVSKKTTYFRVDSNCAIILKGLKFVEGGGWGRYHVYRGTEILVEFSKSKLVQEDGILMNLGVYYPDDVLGINQIQGEGELQVELLGIKLTPPGILYPLREYE